MRVNRNYRSKGFFYKNKCNCRASTDEEPTDDDDQLMQDLMKDPIFQADMEEMLTKFLQNFSREEHFRAFVGHLNPTEKQILQGIQVTL